MLGHFFLKVLLFRDEGLLLGFNSFALRLEGVFDLLDLLVLFGDQSLVSLDLFCMDSQLTLESFLLSGQLSELFFKIRYFMLITLFDGVKDPRSFTVFTL